MLQEKFLCGELLVLGFFMEAGAEAGKIILTPPEFRSSDSLCSVPTLGMCDHKLNDLYGLACQ